MQKTIGSRLSRSLGGREHEGNPRQKMGPPETPERDALILRLKKRRFRKTGKGGKRTYRPKNFFNKN